LTDALWARVHKLVFGILQGRALTRDALLAGLEREGISTAGGRAYHIPWRLAQERVLCFGPREGKQKTFVLLDEWVPKSRLLSGEEALAELALRYFTSHGPATLADFVWWSGLKVAAARAGLEAVSARLASGTVDGKVYWMPCDTRAAGEAAPGFLLPGFDEYLLGYTDRGAVLDARHAPKVVPGSNGIFLPMLVQDGRVIGTWSRSLGKKVLTIKAAPFTRMASRSFGVAARRYGEFLGTPAQLSVGP
jgi:hypothetical protein